MVTVLSHGFRKMVFGTAWKGYLQVVEACGKLVKFARHEIINAPTESVKVRFYSDFPTFRIDSTCIAE